jgi:hypothetical protein
MDICSVSARAMQERSINTKTHSRSMDALGIIIFGVVS